MIANGMRKAVGLIVAILLFAHIIVASGLVVCMEPDGGAALEWAGATCCSQHDNGHRGSAEGPTVDQNGCGCHDELVGTMPATASGPRDASADIAELALLSTVPASWSTEIAAPARFDLPPVIDDTRSELSRRSSVVLRC